MSGPTAVKTKSAGLTNVTFLSKVNVEVRSPPVTDVLKGIVTPPVALVTILPTCIVPVGVVILTVVPAITPPVELEIAVPSFKLKLSLGLTVTL